VDSVGDVAGVVPEVFGDGEAAVGCVVCWLRRGGRLGKKFGCVFGRGGWEKYVFREEEQEREREIVIREK